GLNTPTWALVNGEKEHGITWHRMLTRVDQGDIYHQIRFPLVDDETAFSLNVKCYEHGFEGFEQVLSRIESNTLQGTPQDLSRLKVFYRTDRPSLGGWLDWDQPAEMLERLVRALDFGSYENPVATPRVLLNGRALIVKDAVAEDGSGEPGQIMSLEDDILRVGTGEGLLAIRTLLDGFTGKTLDMSALDQQGGFQVLTEADRQALNDMTPVVARKESKWLRRFASLHEFDSPIRATPDTAHNPVGSMQSLSLADFPVTGLDVMALTGAFWARLGKSDAVDLPVRQGQAGASVFLSEGFVTSLPVTVDLSGNPDPGSLAGQFEGGMHSALTNQGYTSDLLVRYPRFAALPGCWMSQAHGIALITSDTGVPDILPAALNIVWDRKSDQVSWYYLPELVDQSAAQQFLEQFRAFAAAVAEGASPRTATLLTPRDRELLASWNATDIGIPDRCVHQLIEAQALAHPEAPALACGDVCLTYDELNRRANQMAHYLIEQGVRVSDRVGILMDRSEQMVIAMIGAWKAGASYVPLDPAYPVDRIQYMIDDSSLAAIITEQAHARRFKAGAAVLWVLSDRDQPVIAQQDQQNPNLAVLPNELAYTIYTSGSTGKPKGVMVEHCNVVNFFVGMDDRIDHEEPGTWLAVTSMSFDISVLELFWTLSRGFKVVVYQDERKALSGSGNEPGLDFSLFYWNVASEAQEKETDKYRLLLQSAQYGDKHGFKAVWTPERHFAAFGALFPNPSVTSAALATITENIEIRAGSCVAPLHSPIRIAEDWAVVDNLSKGRVGLAFAAGWAPKDFAIKPESFPNAKQTMMEYIDTVRDLWKGKTKTFQGGTGEVEVQTLPRPVQSDLPIWVTTAGNIDTYLQAAEKRAGILTHLLGQTIEEVGDKIAAYRARWKECGHPGEGHVVVMLHTLIGESEAAVEKVARGPMKEYLKSAMFLVKQAAWNFPIYRQMSEAEGKSLDELFETLSEEDYDQVLDFAFERYYGTSGLFGTPESAMKMVKAVKKAGANEIGCLIDFGMATDVVLEHLPYLNELREKARHVSVEPEEMDVPASMDEQFSRHQVSHFQCTPSMATMLVNEPSLKQHLGRLKQMMVGGEAMPPQLARDLAAAVPGRVTNMYGPTETTIWSSTQDVSATGDVVPIGKPIANTRIFIVDEHQQPLPVGAVGEIVICGKGVVRGYHERPELNTERFLTLLVDGVEHQAYRTGDLGRWTEDGVLQCLGRQDHQVKIRGYRIELGEIEAQLRNHPRVAEAAVDVIPERQQLAAFYRVAPGEPPSARELESFLSAKLPEFMVPAFYRELKVIPQTPNGKIDRKALPKAELDDSGKASGVDYVPPGSEIEEQVAAIWQRALGLSTVGINDNFFDIGGHSILALQVLQELRKITDKPLQMTDLFKYTTVATIAEFLGASEQETGARNQIRSRGAARKAAMNRRRGRRR
ncbi:MAG: LLM class flavin-dependent oxidoreductase, partial [Ketobacteraceae bacterium]|nr:LLM class flavin-dependent oxidoreductase [Ketobacteraceae bacterium]